MDSWVIGSGDSSGLETKVEMVWHVYLGESLILSCHQEEKRKTSEGVPGSSEGGQVGVTEDDARKRVRRFTVIHCLKSNVSDLLLDQNFCLLVYSELSHLALLFALMAGCS